MATIDVIGSTLSIDDTNGVLDYFNRCNIDAYCNLLPVGAMWPRIEGTSLHQTCSSLGIELGRVDRQIDWMLAESYPDTAQQTLTLWEFEVGLPDPCVGELADNIPDRQQDVVDKWRQDHVLNDEFWGLLAGTLGYAAPVVTKTSAFCTGKNCAGDPLCPLEALLTVTFTFASAADDELLECKIRTFFPPWSELVIVFT